MYEAGLYKWLMEREKYFPSQNTVIIVPENSPEEIHSID